MPCCDVEYIQSSIDFWMFDQHTYRMTGSCVVLIFILDWETFSFSPLMERLGIDSRGRHIGKGERNWVGVRSFFERRLPE